MKMMIPPYFDEIPFKTAERHAIAQTKVPDHVGYVLFVPPSAEKIESPIPLFPLRGGERLKDAILALTASIIAANCRKSDWL
jgi:hypothetical protein